MGRPGQRLRQPPVAGLDLRRQLVDALPQVLVEFEVQRYTS